MYSQLKLPVVNTIVKDSIITLFLANQKRIEEAHFKHFQDIKSICKASQLNDFSALTQELGKMFSNQNSKPHPPMGKPPRNEDFPRPQEKKIKRDKPMTRITRHRQEMKIDRHHHVGMKNVQAILVMKTVLCLHRETRLLT